jgi:hypothetical protein
MEKIIIVFMALFQLVASAELQRINIHIPESWYIRFFEDGVAKVNFGASAGDEAVAEPSHFKLTEVADYLLPHLEKVEPWPKTKKPFLTVSISYVDGKVGYYVPKTEDRSVFLKLIRKVLRVSKPWDDKRFDYLLSRNNFLGIDAAAFREIQASNDPELDLTLKPEPPPRAVEPTKSAAPAQNAASDATKPLLNGGASTTMLATGVAILLIAIGWYIYKVLGKRS